MVELEELLVEFLEVVFEEEFEVELEAVVLQTVEVTLLVVLEVKVPAVIFVPFVIV